ncbi:MAG: hypothetical protein AAGI69_03435 [Cyanobacteria bacterium P01_H01_bin.21]
MELAHNLPDRTTPLTTEFVLITVQLQANSIALRNHIETQLKSHGEPLRWAITAIDQTTAQVEAVVTVNASNQSS